MKDRDMNELESIDASFKAKPISARVNEHYWEAFRDICKKRGVSANAQINMLIVDFVRNNEK